jgi:hypothetical protein
MYRFKLLFLISFFAALVAHAQEEMPDVKASDKSNLLNLTTVSVSYLSWTEFVDLDNGLVVDRSYANFYGVALAYEKENFDKRWGTSIEGSVLSGQANAGGTQTAITYQTSYHNWYGASASYKLAYRLSPQITLAVGPAAIYRNIKWPVEGTNITVTSGAPLNVAAIFDLRIRMTRQWEIRQTIGTLAFKASTIWSLGLGYKF